MFDAFKKLQLSRAFLGHPPAPSVVDEGGEYELGELIGALRTGVTLSLTPGINLEEVMAHPGVTEFYESRYLPEPATLDELSRYDDDTLGHEYARFLRWSGWRPANIPPGFTFEDRDLYVRTRTQMTYGLLHLVNNYDLSEAGVLAQQAFYLAQTGSQQAAALVASGFVRVLGNHPGRLTDFISLMSEAHERGRAARHYLSMAWEELWSAPLEQVRELVGLTPRATRVARINMRAPVNAPPQLELGPKHVASDTDEIFQQLVPPSTPRVRVPTPPEPVPVQTPPRATPPPSPPPRRQPPPSRRPSASRSRPRRAPAPAPTPPPRSAPAPAPAPQPTPQPAPQPAPAPKPDASAEQLLAKLAAQKEEIDALPPGRHVITSLEPDNGYPDEDDPDFF